jgi:hypothetical protein
MAPVNFRYAYKFKGRIKVSIEEPRSEGSSGNAS